MEWKLFKGKERKKVHVLDKILEIVKYPSPME